MKKISLLTVTALLLIGCEAEFNRDMALELLPEDRNNDAVVTMEVSKRYWYGASASKTIRNRIFKDANNYHLEATKYIVDENGLSDARVLWAVAEINDDWKITEIEDISKTYKQARVTVSSVSYELFDDGEQKPPLLEFIATYRKYREGWRLKDFKLDQEPFKLISKITALNGPLWRMHRKKKYVLDWEDLTEQLLELANKDYRALDTAAFAYYDNDNALKAVEIMEDRVMPIVALERVDVTAKYQKNLNKFKHALDNRDRRDSDKKTESNKRPKIAAE